MADPVVLERRLLVVTVREASEDGHKRASSAMAAAAPRTRSAVDDGPRRGARTGGAGRAPDALGRRRPRRRPPAPRRCRPRAPRDRRAAPRSSAARTCRSASTRAWSDGSAASGPPPRAWWRRRGGRRRARRGAGRSSFGSGFVALGRTTRGRGPGSRDRAAAPAAPRPRAIRERTVPGRDAEDLRDLGVVEVAQVAEHDGGPELLGELGEGGVDGHPVGEHLDAGRRVQAQILVVPVTEVVGETRRPGAACAAGARRGRRWWPPGRPRWRRRPARRSGGCPGRWRSGPPGWRRGRRPRCRPAGGTRRGSGRGGGGAARRGRRASPCWAALTSAWSSASGAMP